MQVVPFLGIADFEIHLRHQISYQRVGLERLGVGFSPEYPTADYLDSFPEVITQRERPGPNNP